MLPIFRRCRSRWPSHFYDLFAEHLQLKPPTGFRVRASAGENHLQSKIRSVGRLWTALDGLAKNAEIRVTIDFWTAPSSLGKRGVIEEIQTVVVRYAEQA
jgi:hypothetical protein